jgi:phosphoglycerol transferase
MQYFFTLSLLLFIFALLIAYHHSHSKKSTLLGAGVVFVYLFLSAFYVVADYFTGEGINDAVIFHLRYGLDGSGFGDYYLIMVVAVVLLIMSLMSSLAYYRYIGRKAVVEPTRFRKLLALGLMLGAFGVHPSLFLVYRSVPKAMGFESSLAREFAFSEYYQLPSLKKTSEEHPNLVYIFAESFETTYFDETIFPSLVTHLRELQTHNTYFTDIRQALGTSWTIAGMTASLCGLPLVTPTTNEHSPQGNSMSKMRTFYSGAVCMSDLLHQEGYKMVYRSGSDLSFAGVDKLYKTHHFDDVKGIKELKPLLKNPSYQTPWGLYDDTLFELALNDFKKLSKSKQKFALYLSTMDTHHPYGHVSKSCQTQTYKDGSNTMLNAVACSDELIVRFIKQIQESPYGKNTVIVVGSDHLSMHNMAIDDLMKGERRNQFMIIDPHYNEGRKVEKQGSTLDISATLLPFLGYEGKMGLGRNLLSDEQSLMEEFSHFDKLLDAWNKDIARFWEFPKIEENVTIDFKKQMIKLGKTSYALPVLLRLSDTLEVSPFFEVKLKFFETTKLFGYLHDFAYDEPFIWIDRCSRIGVLDEKINAKGKWCLSYGKLGSTMTTRNFHDNTTLTLSDINATLGLEATEEKALVCKEKLIQIKEK